MPKAALPAAERPEKMFLGLPVWGWLGGAFAIALVLGFVFYSNSAKLARHGEASILSSAAPVPALSSQNTTP